MNAMICFPPFQIPYVRNGTRRYFSIIKNSVIFSETNIFHTLPSQSQSDSFDKVQSYGHFIEADQ